MEEKVLNEKINYSSRARFKITRSWGKRSCRCLGFVECEAEAVWGTVQWQFAWWQESVWARCGLIFLRIWVVIVIGLWDVVVLLANGWDWSGRLVLVVIVVLGWCSRTVDWGWTAITLESWVVPSFIIRSIIELVRGVILVDVVALRLRWLILWLNRLWNGLWWRWWGDWQVIPGGLESK